MRNPNPDFHSLIKPWRFLIKSSLLLLLSSSIYGIIIDSEQNQSMIQWHVVTKTNFSTQLQHHHHVLLMVTVPWSGEARSLMKEVADAASLKQKLDGLTLMVLYKNKEKMLADALGVTEETTIFFYHNAVSYKYQGILRTQNILSSVDYLMSSRSEDLPLTLLNTQEDLSNFVQSTDKTVLLLEFCGWTQRLLSQEKNNGSEYDFPIGGSWDTGVISGANFNGGETYLNLTSSGDKYEKGLNNEKLTCDPHSEAGGIPWVGGFTTINDSTSSEAKSNLPGVGLSCTYDEFQQFQSFFPKFMTFAREFFLPPERQRFGMIFERHLLSSLGVGDPDSWLVTIHFAGCSNCSQILREGDDLRTAFNMHQLPVHELGSEPHNDGSTLPGNKPSAVLFVDRSSESLKTRIQSKVALETFRKLALDNQIAGPDNMAQRKSADHTLRGLKSESSKGSSMYSIRDSSSLNRVDHLKNTMSVMVINEDGNFAVDANTQGLSIQDILTRLVQQKKEAKLSYVAKEVGFQLLSEDFDVKLAELLEPQAESTKSNEEHSTENNIEGDLNLGIENNVANREKITITVKDIPESSTQLDKWEEEQPSHEEHMGFYFSDGNSHLLKSLTSRSEVPSVIIIDPVSQKHYIYPKEEAFSYSSLQFFLDAFHNGSLIPFQRSEPAIVNHREAVRPPFVNLDFHEMDSIPRVTVNTFSELVLGFNQSENKNTGFSWNKDVLVLFSNSWCAFCQRMELVVHEVFRSLAGHFDISEFPLIFLMDCTLNDCSALLKATVQREVYPSLLLFPAQRKTAISYQGVVSVNNIIKFLMDQGSNSHHLLDVSVEAEQNEAPASKMPDQLHTPNDINGATLNVNVGSVLIATEKLLNAPPFDKSKILIVEANQTSGFQGVIVNKHISWESFEWITKNLELVKKAQLSFGGPLIANGMPLVSLTRRKIHQSSSEVFRNMYFLDQSATFKEIEGFEVGDKSIGDYWFFLGYASWGWQQLFDEIAEGAWQISDDPSAEFNWPRS